MSKRPRNLSGDFSSWHFPRVNESSTSFNLEILMVEGTICRNHHIWCVFIRGVSIRSTSCFLQMSNGFYLVKQRIVLRRTPVCQKNHNQAVKRGRNTPRTRQASNVKHLAIKNKCSIGERGQTPQNVTGLENEVGTPRQLRFVPNNFRGSYIYI